MIWMIAGIIDVVMTLVSVVMAFVKYARGDVQAAIFWILVALWFGRGHRSQK